MDYEVGDIVKLKKQHPCGSKEWRILRVGADFRLECMGCSHQIMIPRKQVEKNNRGHIFGSQHFITPSSHSFTLKKKKR